MKAHVHFGSYFQQDGMRDHGKPLFEPPRKQGSSTSFDTVCDAGRQCRRTSIHALPGATDLFIPGEEELLHIYGAATLEAVWGSCRGKRGWWRSNAAQRCFNRGRRCYP